MPYCPECRGEYRAGFTTCADCNIPLLEGDLEPLPASPPSLSSRLRAGAAVVLLVAGVGWAVQRMTRADAQRRSIAAAQSRQAGSDRWILDVGIRRGDTLETVLARCGPPSDWIDLSGVLAGSGFPSGYVGKGDLTLTYDSGWRVTLMDGKVGAVEPIDETWHMRHPDGMGWDPNEPTQVGKTPDAVLRDELEGYLVSYSPLRLRDILNRGADPKIRTSEEKKTILHIAAAKNDAETITLALGKGADAKARDSDRSTPLHFVRSVEAARALIDAGAGPNPTNNFYLTPLDSAIQRGESPSVQDFLRSRGGRTTPMGRKITTILRSHR